MRYKLVQASLRRIAAGVIPAMLFLAGCATGPATDGPGSYGGRPAEAMNVGFINLMPAQLTYYHLGITVFGTSEQQLQPPVSVPGHIQELVEADAPWGHTSFLPTPSGLPDPGVDIARIGWSNRYIKEPYLASITGACTDELDLIVVLQSTERQYFDLRNRHLPGYGLFDTPRFTGRWGAVYGNFEALAVACGTQQQVMRLDDSGYREIKDYQAPGDADSVTTEQLMFVAPPLKALAADFVRELIDEVMRIPG